jgi:hypothetical protein
LSSSHESSLSVRPFFGPTETQVVAQDGAHAYFHCQVSNIANQTVSNNRPDPVMTGRGHPVMPGFVRNAVRLLMRTELFVYGIAKRSTGYRLHNCNSHIYYENSSKNTENIRQY